MSRAWSNSSPESSIIPVTAGAERAPSQGPAQNGDSVFWVEGRDDEGSDDLIPGSGALLTIWSTDQSSLCANAVSSLRPGPTPEILFPTVFHRMLLFCRSVSDASERKLRIPSQERTPKISGSAGLGHQIATSSSNPLVTLYSNVSSINLAL